MGEPQHTPAEVRELSGLTYRMLHVWENAGLLPDRQSARSWRRFTPREMFMLFVLVEFRRRFQVPLPKLKYVRDFMLQDGADHLSAAATLMGTLGIPVYLATDFEDFFVMDSTLEFHDLIEYAALPDSMVMIRVNPIVHRILTALNGAPQIDDKHGRGRELFHALKVRSPEEFRLLQLVRGDDFSRVEVIKKDGEIDRFEFERTLVPDSVAALSDLLDEADTQKLNLSKLRGNVTSVTQRVTEKVSARKNNQLRLRSPQEAPDRDAAEKENKR